MQEDDERHERSVSADPALDGRRGGTVLSINSDTSFSDAAVRGFMDDWLVHTLVEKFIESRLVKLSQEDQGR